MRNNFNSEKSVRSRDYRMCDWCTKRIPPKEPHMYMRGVWDGSWFTFRAHTCCAKMRDWEFREYTLENFGLMLELDREALREIAVGARTPIYAACRLGAWSLVLDLPKVRQIAQNKGMSKWPKHKLI